MPCTRDLRGVSGHFVTAAVLALGLWLLGVSPLTSAYAGPAAPGAARYSQPNGATFRARTVGDEWWNAIETVDGYTAVRNAAGVWCYAETQPDGTLASGPLEVTVADPARLGLNQALRPTRLAYQRARAALAPVAGPPAPGTPSRSAGTAGGASSEPPPPARTVAQPPVGNRKLLFILVQFSDISLSTTTSAWAARGFGATNSFRDYYAQVAQGAFTVSPAPETYDDPGDGGDSVNDGIVKVTLARTHPNFGGSLGGEIPKQLAKDAVTAADPFVDYAALDTNGDGAVGTTELGVLLIIAGYEASFSGAPSPNVWAHHFYLFGSTPPPTLDGKTVCGFFGDADTRTCGYGMFGEMQSFGATPGPQATIGVIAHEYGHELFLPDLYDTDGSSEGIGDFGLMGSGSHTTSGGQVGDSPAHFCPWSRMELGWVPSPSNAANGPNTLGDSATEPNGTKFLKVPISGTTTEFFLIENRNGGGYDAGLPGSAGARGLLIWHIDNSKADNTNENNYMVDVEEASGTQHLQLKQNRGQGTDFWRSGTATVFDDSTTPNANRYSGAATNIAITAISASGASMTFTLGTDVTPPAEVTNFVGTPGDTRVDFTWSNPADPDFAGVRLRRRAGATPPANETDGVLVFDGVATSAADTGLTNGQGYSYAIFTYDTAPNFSAGSTLSNLVPGDTTPPGPVTSLSATAGDTQIALAWTNPGDADFNGVRIKRKLGSFPTGPTDGTTVLDTAVTSTTSFTDTGLANGTTYFYGVFAKDTVPNYAAAAEASATPAAPPPAAPADVSGLTGTPGDSQVTLAWTDPPPTNHSGTRILRRIGQTPSGPLDASATLVADVARGVTAIVDGTVANGTTYFYALYTHDAGSNFAAGVTVQATPLDLTPPGNVTSFTLTPADGQMGLSWGEPTDADFAGVTVRRSIGVAPSGPTDGDLVVDAPKGTTSHTDPGLTNGTVYRYAAFARDSSDNFAAGVQASAAPADVTPPGPVTGLAGVAGNGSITLSWTNPTDADFQGVRIVRRTDAFPTGPIDGVIVFEGNVTSFTDTGLTNQIIYYYAIYARDEVPNFSSALSAFGQPEDSISGSGCDSIPSPRAPAGNPATWIILVGLLVLGTCRRRRV